MKAVILAGGAGDRLWPLSRKNFPKQFLQQNNGNSLFQETVIRNIPFCDEIIVITNVEYREIAEGQLQEFQGIPYSMILEEEAKGTAPAIAVASYIVDAGEDILILPSDLLLYGDGYSDAIYQAKELSDLSKIVLFGTRAEEPIETYGYIRYNGNEVSRFIEKPSRVLAERIFADDDILWNSGLLLCKNELLRSELAKQANSLSEWAKLTSKEMLEGHANLKEKNRFTISSERLQSVKRIHIEHVLLEHSESLAVVPLKCKWQDISNFETYGKTSLLGEEKDTIKVACNNTTVVNMTNHQLVVANGMEDTVIVNTEDAVYISRKDVEQDIKGIIANSPKEYDEYFQYTPKTYRTWGTREIIAQAPGYRVRKLEIYPGTSISSHRHAHRNENYSVIKGQLTLEINQKKVIISAGESVNVLPGQMHRLYNETDQLVIAIEVDTGEEIDERDMIHVDELKEEVSHLPNLYRLSPAYKDYLWGGNRLVTDYGKNSPFEITAESWELSAHKDGQSIISGGLLDGKLFGDFVIEHGSDICGWKSKTFDRFPILIKFIDALNPLSVQIHPYDDYAFVHEKEFGKNEMWYIMDALPDAYLYCGFSRDVTKEEIRKRIEENTITEVLNKVSVKKGDVIFIPAGTIHAIGAGILICEIQQNSNSTYRVYDYNRVDKDGNHRQLHVDKAMDVITTSIYEATGNGLENPVEIECGTSQQLCMCKYFACKKYTIDGEISLYLDDSSFASLVILSGQANITCENENISAKAADSIFVSAGRKTVRISGTCEFILTNI